MKNNRSTGEECPRCLKGRFFVTAGQRPAEECAPSRHSDRSARGTSARSGGISRHFCRMTAARVGATSARSGGTSRHFCHIAAARVGATSARSGGISRHFCRMTAARARGTSARSGGTSRHFCRIAVARVGDFSTSLEMTKMVAAIGQGHHLLTSITSLTSLTSITSKNPQLSWKKLFPDH
jgi:hypothetical protein